MKIDLTVAAAIAGKDPAPLLASGAAYAHEDLLANDGFGGFGGFGAQ